MFTEMRNSGFMREVVLRSIKFPMVYFVLGVLAIIFSYTDDVFHLQDWKNIFSLSNIAGEILIAFAVLTFIYNFVATICSHFEAKYEANHQVNALIFSNLLTGARIIYVLVFINILISLIGFNDIYLTYANAVLNVIIIGTVGWVAVQLFYTFEAVLYQYMMRLTASEHIRVKALYTKIHIIRNIATVIIILLTVAAILMSFSSVRNIGISLLASAGFLTAIIGLSAQKALFSMFSGLQIALAQPIKIGDVVVIEGNSGIIEEITFTYVTLKLGDRKRLMVPINYFIDKPFENWSREGESLRSSFKLHIDYLLPIEPLRKELEKILNASEFWDHKASKLEVSDITHQTVELRVQVSAANADNLSDLRAHVKEKLLEYIRTHHPEHFPKMRLSDKK